MTWLEHHTRSENLASQAEAALRRGDRSAANELYRESAEQETLALSTIDTDRHRTLGIIAVSSASLWYKSGEYRETERIACHWLATDYLPDFASNQLQEILQTTWNEIVLRQSGIEFVKGEVLVSVSGGEIVTGGAPLELVHRKVSEIRNIYFRTIEMLLNRPFRKRGRPSADIQEQFRPWLLQAPAGSYQFAIRVQKPTQMPLFEGDVVGVEEVTDRFIQIVDAASKKTHEELTEIVPDSDYRDGFLKLTRNLAPTGKTYDRLEIRTADDLEKRPIVFVPESRKDLNKTIREKKKSVEEQIAFREKRLTGVLRALHLDRDWIELRTDDDRVVHISRTGEVIDDLVGPMVNHRVIVDTVITPDGRHLYQDIQPEE